MKTSISQDHLADYVCRQINLLFPDCNKISKNDLVPSISDALARVEYCFLRVRINKYCFAKEAVFDHLYSDQYLVFLWFLSNSLFKRGANTNILNKIYLLNKSLHGFDCIFDTQLPSVFIVIHGVGTVLGKAHYGDFLTIYQGCTVGQTQGIYPRLGRGVGLGAGAALIGDCTLGDFASIGAGCTLVNANVNAASTIYRDNTGTIICREGQRAAIASQYFLDHFLFTPEVESNLQK